MSSCRDIFVGNRLTTERIHKYTEGKIRRIEDDCSLVGPPDDGGGAGVESGK